ncbi:peptidase S8 [Chitinophagaceae bacterium IBVUCB2]|nr:peptidase S8 [Chitinophagaceae bacterium IBVUCB2]
MISLMKRATLFTISGLISALAFSQTSQPDDVPKGWHLLDKQVSGYYGISIDKAYDFVKTKKLKSKTVIVAVIDSGIDTLHEDLKPVLWKNSKEIPGNGIDDDKNGYVDDIYGWNFLGGRDGKSVEQDSYEAARVYHKFKSKYDGKEVNVANLSKEEAMEYQMWKRAEKDVVGDTKSSSLELLFLKRAYAGSLKSDSILRKAMGKEKFTGKELGEFTSTDPDVKKAKNSLYGLMSGNDALETTNQEFLEGFGDYVNGEEKKATASTTPPKTYRADIVKDNYDDFNDRFYGNPDVMVSNKSALHGTHVSGIIGASRTNNVGMKGVADNVKIMSLRAVPDGDEHDKDIALAIRYAVDNGAHVINMSFGKSFSPEKKWVDEAVKYAESKGVLLVHAAGNDAKNLDTSYNYPSPVFDADNKRAGNWITVGASGDPKAGGLTASFSNYGKKEVDVFAPGVRIYSTVPGGNTYQNLQGTSMASPVVAGVAAFILEYYPNLSPAQVKMVLEKSSKNPGVKVKNPETGDEVDLNEISKAGGVINAYEAIKLASTLKGERQQAPVKPTSTVKPKVKG